MIVGFLLLATVSSHKVESEVTPIQKVLQMMDDMVAKGEEEKHAEEVSFKAFAQFCSDTTSEKTTAIERATARIGQLNADILKAQADQTELADELKVLQENLDAFTTEKEKVEGLKDDEEKEYQKVAADYKESIDAMENAISKMKEQLPSMLQLKQVASLDKVPKSVKRSIAAYLAMKEDDDEETEEDPDKYLEVAAPEAASYEFASGGIIDMLEKIDGKFKSELREIEKAHIQAKHGFEMQIQKLHDQIQDAEEETDLKTKVKAERAQDEATAKGDLATTTADKEADEKYLKDLTTECDKKSTDFAARQKLRAEELEAIHKAKEIIASPDVTGLGEKHLPQLIQVTKAKATKKSMALLRSNADAPVRAKLMAFLSNRAKSTQSKLLLSLAEKVADGPFDKVKKMIKDMIVKLMEEATEESEHKGWCDTEMASNKQTREDKSDSVSTLSAQQELLTAKISTLGSDMAELSDAISAIDAAVAEATTLRLNEKSKNTVAIEDAKVAQVAVAKALAVLQEFYAKAATATAFVQQTPAEDAPATFDKPYTGMGGSNTGVVGMLEVIQGDFARLETETGVAEKEAEAEFERFSDDSAQDKSVKSMDLENKGKDKATAESDLASTQKDLAATQTELDAALAYYDKLKPSCVDAGLSYGERVRMREEEIKSLQEALRILSGEDI
jgi:hypothetical protein